MATFLTVDDLTPFAEIDAEKAFAMIDDASAMAVLAAPCLATEPSALTAVQTSAVRAILRGAILRWHEAGSGALQSETAGVYSYSVDNRQARKGMFWPSEIVQLQDICKGEQTSGAFAVDTVGVTGLSGHSDVCALYFGADYCSCGYVLTQSFPLYEVS